jgi:hypothetical protein
MESGEIRDYTSQFGGGSANGERDAQEIRRKELLATTKITGWFAWLLFVETAGGILSLCMAIATVGGSSGGFDSLLAHPLLGGVDLVTGVFLLILGFVAPAKARHRSADAVFYLRLYMAYCLTLNIVSHIVGADAGMAERVSSGSALRGLIWPAIWLVYTFKSLDVSTVFPKDYRRVPRSAIAIAVLLFAIPAVMFGVGLLRAKSMAANWGRPEIQQSALAAGEYTDGHIVLAAPDGATVRHDGSTVLYSPLSVEKGGEYGGFVATDMFSSKDEKTFDAIRDNAKDSALSFAKESSVKTSFDELPEDLYGARACVRMKSVRLVDDEIDIRWRFAVIYAPQYAKVAILSFYDKGDGAYFKKLVKSVRFTAAGRSGEAK